MTKLVKEISCPGCLRTGQTLNPRLCPECLEDLKRQACVVCSAPVQTDDVPHVLCADCTEACEQAEAQDTRQ